MRWRHRLKLEDKVLGIGIDRIDYTKGIPERIRAIDRLLDEHPEHRGQLVFVQIGVPSRMHIEAYKTAGRRDRRAGRGGQLEMGHRCLAADRVREAPLRPGRDDGAARLAQFCVVSSLHDGMNLVAKEFVASRVDEDGVLILSQFTGAAGS